MVKIGGHKSGKTAFGRIKDDGERNRKGSTVNIGKMELMLIEDVLHQD